MREHNNEQNKEKIRHIKVSAPVQAVPVFSNSVQIHVNDDSVLLQFVFIRPNSDQAALVAEIAVTPQHAIRLQRALDETIKKHFTRHLR